MPRPQVEGLPDFYDKRLADPRLDKPAAAIEKTLWACGHIRKHSLRYISPNGRRRIARYVAQAALQALVEADDRGGGSYTIDD